MSMTEEEEKQFKEAIKEAAREWLQDQFAMFGKWTAIGISSAIFFVVVKMLVLSGDWAK